MPQTHDVVFSRNLNDFTDAEEHLFPRQTNSPLGADPFDHAPATEFERRLVAEIDGGKG